MENGTLGPLNTRNEKESVWAPRGVRPGIRKEGGKCSCVNLAEG